MAEAAEFALPEVKTISEKVAAMAEKEGSKLFSRLGQTRARTAKREAVTEAAAASRKGIPTAEKAAAARMQKTAAAADRDGMSRLTDVGASAVIGQSLGTTDSGPQAAQATTQTSDAALATTPTVVDTRGRDSQGRFVAGGARHCGRGDEDSDELGSSSDEDEKTEAVERSSYSRGPPYRGAASCRAVSCSVTGGQGRPAHPRPLAEQMQIAILIVLLLVIVVLITVVSVKKPGTQTSFWTGMALGAVTGATVYWTLGSRFYRFRAA